MRFIKYMVILLAITLTYAVILNVEGFINQTAIFLIALTIWGLAYAFRGLD